MTDFKITSQAYELLYTYGVFDESDFRNHVQKISTTIKNKTALPPQQSLNTPCCQGNVSAITDLAL